jgi:hypothetical protein
MVLGRAGSAVSRPLRPHVTESGSGTLQVDAVTGDLPGVKMEILAYSGNSD